MIRTLFSILIFFCAAACTRTVYVPVESVRTDSVRAVVVRIDSVRTTDSVYVRERTKNDTVIIEKLKYQYRDRMQMVHDTVYINRRDSVSVPVPVTEYVEVEARLSWWQHLKMSIGGIALAFLAAWIVIWIIKRQK